ncbi:gastrula zinc finger protein XlCGF57.1-like [Mercenaria mercenaria]|uniref:gastrula zinc finger protein XlCGF57.1-like n=1 Tax=Mercenaria mercenaria TaxID=6596 RepID=UPI00234EC2F2|nr:gastrula zinc finger protein XlCGF57.1-like [Mercenaria mercenaria]
MCGKGFATKWKLDTHMRVHTGERPFRCSICGRQFNQKSNLKRHQIQLPRKKITSFHHQSVTSFDSMPIKTFDCLVCDYLLDNILNSSGVSQDADRIRVYVCKICGKACPSQWKLDRHMHTHTGERPYECEVCGKRFTQKNAAWPSTSELPMTINDNSISLPGMVAKSCHLCGKVFSSNWSLKRHSRIHTGERPFVCSLCDKRFIEKCKLRAHMLTHLRLLP